MRSTRILVAALLALALPATPPPAAQETERLMLSGTGYGDAVHWDFTVTGGRRAGEAATIPVPSQWEQHGFGAYNYGHDDDKAQEEGRYRHRFHLPAEWRGRAVDLVFEGVMTDAEARVNGQPAGEAHRGGFYRFRYDVSGLLRFGAENSLEVDVRKHSADKSVNRAEREADYWVFGGIYRPVYLEARPSESIDRVAIDARHDGGLTLSARMRGLAAPAELTARIETLEGETIHGPFATTAEAGEEPATLSTRVGTPRPWSAESPHLYRLVMELERDGTVLHRHAERFGFRTVEVRHDGLFVNGRRVLLKGVNRHAFWPASGRTLNREIDFRDAGLIKNMNMNAVRASHYPPDVSFLDACDELGIYVVDELAGWHDAYSTAVGRDLVREMVERDVNHPSVILWANGNEGGWNSALDGAFGEHDVQGRPVFHPHESFGGFDAAHYPSWPELEASLDPSSWRNRWRSLFGELPLVMPTEVLHGLYDGGSGAGLDDYWRRLRSSPRGAGAFLWSFADEAVERSDRGGALDTDGNHAPDGVLGPYRELTGNFYAVREVFSPIRIARRRFDGAVELENRFDETDLSRCRFEWSLEDLPGPAGGGPGDDAAIVRLEGGTLSGPAIPPGGRGELRLPPAVDWRSADALRLLARDPAGREVGEWRLPTRDLRADSRALAAAGDGRVEAAVSGGRLVLRTAAAGAELDLTTGELRSLRAGGAQVPFAGPRPAAGEEAVPVAVRHSRQGSAYVVEASYEQRLSAVRWTLFPSGWLRLGYRYLREGPQDYFGVRFETPRGKVEGFRWLGGGPARVWKNRRAGARLGVWAKGGRSTPAASPHEPKLEGFYAGVYWAEIATAEGAVTIVVESPDLTLGLFASPFPDDALDAVAAMPDGVSFLHGISAIGTKFHPAEELGPAGRRNLAQGLYQGVVWLRLSP